jgi:hypothetical protein
MKYILKIQKRLLLLKKICNFTIITGITTYIIKEYYEKRLFTYLELLWRPQTIF